MELTREEVVKMINDAIELALVNKCNTIHNHDEVYTSKNDVYTKQETNELMKVNENKLNNLVSDKLKKITDELTISNSNQINSRETNLTNITKHLTEIDNMINSINTSLNEINIDCEKIAKANSNYFETVTTLMQEVNRIKEYIPELVTSQEFNAQFEIIEKKVFNL